MKPLKVHEITLQVRVSDYEQGYQWYEKLFGRPAEFIPHEDFAEWEIRSGCWLQVAKGEPAAGSGPLRLGVTDIEKERDRIVSKLGIEVSPVNSREGVPAKWCTFTDPWKNRLGLFEDLS
ncbi:MAG TPA: VOC family protein [Bacillales bacterium]